MSYIEISHLKKSFLQEGNGKSLSVLNDISLSIESGELVTILGPNACGKSTLLNIISGLLQHDSGEIKINDKPPSLARIGYVFQDYRDSLLPWRYNIDNIAFPLELAKQSKKERREKAREIVYRFNIKIPELSYPYHLSGGQAQLVAIFRALISNPDVLLMDEPFNQLDYQTRIFMQDKLLEIWRETGITILFVSHSIEEAVLLGERIIILSKKPAMISKIIKNSLPRDRNHEFIKSDLFFEGKKEALNQFEMVIA